jgi:hypothetical protein
MCYNKELSIVIFVFAICVACGLINKYMTSKNQTYLKCAVYIIALSLMQLVEFFLHIYTDRGSATNKVFSFVVFLTFLVQYFLMEFFSTEPALNAIDGIFWILAIGSFVYLCVKFNDLYSIKDCSKMVEGAFASIAGCRLNWGAFDTIIAFGKEAVFKGKVNYLGHIIYGVMLLLYLVRVCYVTLEVFERWVLFFFMAVFFITSLIGWDNSSGSSGSLWCIWTVCLLCFIVLADKHVLNV